MHLTPDQTAWLLSAHPDTWELAAHPDENVIRGCVNHGLVRLWVVSGQRWKLTALGGEVVYELRRQA
jgi:hypothetical protein